jgi:hypothetical protein
MAKNRRGPKSLPVCPTGMFNYRDDDVNGDSYTYT